jgi:hypothetical protein
MTRTTRYILIAGIAVALALLTLQHANANGNDNGPENGNVTCENSVTGEPVSITTVCTSAVEFSPKFFCGAFVSVENEARAQAICGDALAVCGDVGQLAFQVAVTKQTCKNSTDVSQDTAVTCGDVASICSPAFSCPPQRACPSTFVQDAIVKCKSVKVLRNGTIRKRGCTSILDVATAVCAE